MNVLWLVNIIFPYPAKKMGMSENCFGGWLPSMYLELSKNEDINFCIVTSYSGDDLKKFKNKNTTYYLVPDKNCLEYSEEGKKYYREIVSEFHPDIVHIHGTEYPRGLIFQDCNFNIPVVTSIQGLISNVSNVYYSNITLDEATENYYDRGVEYEKTLKLAPSKEDIIINNHEEEYERNFTKKEIPPIKSSINLLSTLKKSMGDEEEQKNLELTDDLFNLIDSMYDERND